jgi:hypothetical protein
VTSTEVKKEEKTLNPLYMIYNVVDDLCKLRITLPFTKVVKIPQEREKILKLLDGPSWRIETIIANPKQIQHTSMVKV